jgi:hypothetical protein
MRGVGNIVEGGYEMGLQYGVVGGYGDDLVFRIFVVQAMVSNKAMLGSVLLERGARITRMEVLEGGKVGGSGVGAGCGGGDRD